MGNYSKLITSTLIVFILLFLEPILGSFTSTDFLDHSHWPVIKRNLLIAIAAWVLIEVTSLLKRQILKRYDLAQEDNLDARKLHTQLNLLEKVVIFVIILIAVAFIMLSIDGIRQIGIGIFASAGVAGIIIGLSAQKVVGALLAGIQIAITQPFRLDDAVVVEGEWGWIEEINLTYVVVRIWDKRRLVLPSTYFLEKPFQNWTRTTADITGTVFLYTDYNVPFNKLREELTRLLEGTPLWDKKVNVLQVTDSKEATVEVRILVSARNSPTAWDLRVYIREKMIEFIQKNYPDSLPRTRVSLLNHEREGRRDN
ncbi:MAG TPA: mechanosensitive ion channel protein MscS [Cryomorphaceae bacterium]|nr:mechanosensitive ion channel protein MscS [Owenweeksia sp.]HAD97391.1 mechanosensitive ion channel protein MscS [Cryomorphaceae bacterium]HBF19870.1 mechanosensitive ion channel protein MscS [Cryomorphaceae bacterium]HCQ15593.1 mechanosensitive ion channel protein MscS [Cryomorphaceae bacterium]|tara:strand:- start:937 stop:1872 length:936 start_codon:yes stop_codon:yes gene_type:complete